MQDASSTDTEANFDIEQFVHTSGEGFGNDRPMDADNGSVDVAALGSVAGTPTVAGKKMSRKEKKQAKREVARLKKEAKLAEKEARKSYTSVKSQLKDRDKELTSKTADARRKREGAKDVVNYIGYNRMYQDGICEVEEGLFSSSISFGDTSYHSVRDEQQKSMFSALTRLYDQFGANTLVQMSVINTPLLKEEVGNRKFFDVARQGNDAARNDAQVFNDILNDKVREGVSNIRRNRYLTYSVTAETADDAARQLSRIETEPAASSTPWVQGPPDERHPAFVGHPFAPEPLQAVLLRLPEGHLRQARADHQGLHRPRRRLTGGQTACSTTASSWITGCTVRSWS